MPNKQKLILSLDDSNQDNLDDDWLLEAQRRAQELDDGLVQPIPANHGLKNATINHMIFTSMTFDENRKQGTSPSYLAAQ